MRDVTYTNFFHISGRITALQFNWNDTDIASGSETGEIILYNVISGMPSKPLTTPKVHSHVVGNILIAYSWVKAFEDATP